MAMYTIETLKEINLSYDHKHGLNQWDVDNVNQFITEIEESRSQDTPQIGDIVEFTNKSGDYYGNAHIERIQEDELYICEQASSLITSIRQNGRGIYTITSGGTWNYIPSNLKYVGKKAKRFNVWGHGGPQGNGLISFLAEVNVWEYTEGNPEYTTKNYDKFHVSIREQKSSIDYKYLITKKGTSYTAFHTDEEYQAWLKTFHGVEKEGVWENNKIVWTYKQEEQCIPLEDYLQIENAVIDSQLCNGCIQECKRVYENTTVKTFLPFQKDKIELKGVKEYMRAY